MDVLLPQIRHRLIRVDRFHPLIAPWTLGQLERELLVMSVEENVEAVPDDRLAAPIRRRDSATVEEHADRSRESALPVLIGHLRPVGLEPADVADVFAVQRASLEP